jgi:hypothetical protein
LVKEVLVADDTIVIRHSIPVAGGPPDGAEPATSLPPLGQVLPLTSSDEERNRATGCLSLWCYPFCGAVRIAVRCERSSVALASDSQDAQPTSWGVPALPTSQPYSPCSTMGYGPRRVTLLANRTVERRSIALSQRKQYSCNLMIRANFRHKMGF